MQRRESTVLSLTMAPVGQASIQARHVPQLSRRFRAGSGDGTASCDWECRGRLACPLPGRGGVSQANFRSTSNSARKSQEPSFQ